MSLQVMGTIEPAAKAVLWSETRQPVQMWTTQMNGLIHSVTFPGMVLDVKGTKPGLLRTINQSEWKTGKSFICFSFFFLQVAKHMTRTMW